MCDNIVPVVGMFGLVALCAGAPILIILLSAVLELLKWIDKRYPPKER